MKKKLPRLKSDKEAEDFVEKADLTEYDLSGMRPIRFEFQPKSERSKYAPAAATARCGEGFRGQGGGSISALHPPGTGRRAAAKTWPEVESVGIERQHRRLSFARFGKRSLKMLALDENSKDSSVKRGHWFRVALMVG